MLPLMVYTLRAAGNTVFLQRSRRLQERFALRMHLPWRCGTREMMRFSAYQKGTRSCAG